MDLVKENRLLEILGSIAQSLKSIEMKMDNTMLQYEKAAKEAEDNKDIIQLQRCLLEKQVIDSVGLETFKMWKQGKTSWN